MVTLRRTLIPIVLGLVLAFGLALLLATGWMNAPRQDVVALLIGLLESGLVSLGLGGAVLVWMQRGRVRLWLQISLVYAVGVAITLFNVYLTANLMFISTHDFLLLTLLLLFASIVSLSLGYALARALAQRVTALHAGAQALAAGDHDVRVSVQGSDELAALAREFNRTAAQLTANAVERARLEDARRDLIAAVSHDLRTPLASLRVMTEALADGLVDDPATTTRYLSTMRAQIAHLSGLIDDLFELAQIDAGVLELELQRVAPGELVGDTVEAMRPQAAAKGVTLAGSIASEAGPVWVAPQKIERVLYNLVTNAIRHTPSDGSVTISVKLLEQSSLPAAELGAAAGGVLFEVADTGSGIASDDLPHVFDRFYRGDKSRSRATGGAGLGLAIARGIIEAHGGRIWIESAQGQGTRVQFVLPRSA